MTPTVTGSGTARQEHDYRSRVLTIFVKELREIFRDRRTVMSVIISPLLVTPLMFAGLGLVISSQTQKQRTKTLHVGIVGSEHAPSIMSALRKIPSLSILPITASEAETSIRERTLNAVAILPDDYESLTASYTPAQVKIMLDGGDENSRTATGRLRDAFSAIDEKIVQARLTAHNLPAALATPISVTEKPIKSGGSAASLILAITLPYTLVAFAFTGAVYSALDQVAGEKERGTLETLLVSPASRRDIVLGKFAAVVTTCIVSSVLSILGLVVTFSVPGAAFSYLSQGGLHLSPIAIAVTLLVIMPLSVLFAGLLLAVSTFARNQKEAQTYIAPLFIVVLMPAMLSMFIGTDVSRTIALVPVLGAAIIIKQALSGSYDVVFIGLAFAGSIVYAALALTFATRLFQNESVLIKA